MPDTHAVLRDEITNDPLGLGYAGMSAAELFTSLASKTRHRVQETFITIRTLLALGLAPNGKWYVDEILAQLKALDDDHPLKPGVVRALELIECQKYSITPEGFDIGYPTSRTMIEALVASGDLDAHYADLVLHLAHQVVSRLDELGVPDVFSGDVEVALAVNVLEAL